MKTNLRNLMGCGLALVLAYAAVVLVQPAAHAQSQPVQASMDARSSFATSLEGQLRQRGIDARVQLEGDQRDVLRVQWQSVSRQNIYSFVNSAAAANAASRGFRTVSFTNGEQRWDYDLARESMVWSSSSAE